ncbi:hypothetical protein FQN60_006517 [Etheostoma spectabile]|uniref:Secreted protein n=1 Tax=Etheostoma spectabile TaxID=54343 RepID=A0A5J5CC11_9PERO|nr:hypothetical protein FQN60_006517 [Etheostoma spectabile]
MSEELLLLLVEVCALLMYRLSSFICRRETAGVLEDSTSETLCLHLGDTLSPPWRHSNPSLTPSSTQRLRGWNRTVKTTLSFPESFKHRTCVYLAAGQLSEVRLQLLSDHGVDGHQAEDAGLPHAALRVVESGYDVRQQLVQRLLGDAFNGPGLHLDGGQVDGVVRGLHDGTEDLDALLRVDGGRQGGGRLLRCTHHLHNRLHDGELSVVLEAGRLIPQDLLQDPQGQRPDRAVLSGHFQQLQQSPPSVLGSPVPRLALGELLQQLPDQLQLLGRDGCRSRIINR